MRVELIVEGNRKVTVSSLHQWRTYGGLLEGIPTDRLNKNILERVKGEAKHHCGSWNVHILEPEQTPISYEGKYPFGTPMELPPVKCIASLYCYQPVRNKERAGSILTVVWFKQDFALPLSLEIIAQFKLLPWSSLAEDFDD